MANSVSILGCGWLGLPVAVELLKKGLIVRGSTTTEEKLDILIQRGIEAFSVVVEDHEVKGNLEKFLQSEILILNFPPERRPDIEEYFKAQLNQLLTHIRKYGKVKHILFISSTSVYPDVNREVYEDDQLEPVKGSGKALLEAEQMLSSQIDFSATILRLAGLIGYDRAPGRFLAGKQNIENGEAPVNLIHQDDCVALITGIIEKGIWGEIFNGCSEVHPSRKEYYTKAAASIGLPSPTFADQDHFNFKIINSDKIRKRLNYNFKYPDPLKLINQLKDKSGLF